MINGTELPDVLKSLMPAKVQVVVGGHVLFMRTPTLAKVGSLQKILAQLDLTPVAKRVASFFMKSSDVKSFGEALSGELVGALQALLSEVGPGAMNIIADGVAALLDTQENVSILQRAEVIGPPTTEQIDGVHIISQELHTFVRDELTVPQAQYIVTEAIKLTNADALGKLLKGLVDRVRAAMATEVSTKPQEKMEPVTH
ncbi:MAG: hypothetical protein ACE366_16490 [Bradymonadia bacterium]